LAQVSRDESVDPTLEYRLLGVRWYGEGLFQKESKSAQEIKASRLYRVCAGDFIYNRLFAWKGSFALVTDEFDGCHASNEFPCFQVDAARLDPMFLLWYFRQEGNWTKALSASVGATPTSRNRLKERAFLGFKIPLPPLAEQQRIVARIEELATKVKEAQALQRVAGQESVTFLRQAKKMAMARPGSEMLGRFVRFQTGYAFKSEWFSSEGIRLVRNANVGHGTLDWSDTVRLDDSRQAGFARFALEEGDILISLDRPIISTGVKVARVGTQDVPSLLLQRVARAQFDNSQVDPDFLFHWFTSTHFVDAIDPGRSNGVPHISHRDIERIPFSLPPMSVQKDIVTYLDDIQSRGRELADMRRRAAEELDAVIPATLHRAFKGEL
jgi:type I restriction enzyme S subunit